MNNIIEINTERIILGVAKKRKQVIYGARSIQAQNNLLSRNTQDWDIFDLKPKQSAKIVERLLDKEIGRDYFYTKEAKHKGTWKVKGIGNDQKRETEDDESIADYSKLTKGTPFVIKNGLRYRSLKEEIKAKKKSVADPKFEFRHEKDKDDLNRVNAYLKIKRLIQ